MRQGVIIYCALCGSPISLGGEKYLGGITVDHIIPKSQGGTLALDNVQPAHQKCNNIKGDTGLGETMQDPDEDYRKIKYLYAAAFLLWAGFYVWWKWYTK